MGVGLEQDPENRKDLLGWGSLSVVMERTWGPGWEDSTVTYHTQRCLIPGDGSMTSEPTLARPAWVKL